jgi:serine/threonine protein kinase
VQRYKQTRGEMDQDLQATHVNANNNNNNNNPGNNINSNSNSNNNNNNNANTNTVTTNNITNNSSNSNNNNNNNNNSNTVTSNKSNQHLIIKEESIIIAEPSKLKGKGNKLSPFAPAFDVGNSPTINPYGGPYGISTLPVAVPPAHIPPAHQATYTTTNERNTSSNHPPNHHPNNNNRNENNNNTNNNNTSTSTSTNHHSQNPHQSRTTDRDPRNRHQINDDSLQRQYGNGGYPNRRNEENVNSGNSNNSNHRSNNNHNHSPQQTMHGTSGSTNTNTSNTNNNNNSNNNYGMRRSSHNNNNSNTNTNNNNSNNQAQQPYMNRNQSPKNVHHMQYNFHNPNNGPTSSNDFFVDEQQQAIPSRSRMAGHNSHRDYHNRQQQQSFSKGKSGQQATLPPSARSNSPSSSAAYQQSRMYNNNTGNNNNNNNGQMMNSQRHHGSHQSNNRSNSSNMNGHSRQQAHGHGQGQGHGHPPNPQQRGMHRNANANNNNNSNSGNNYAMHPRSAHANRQQQGHGHGHGQHPMYDYSPPNLSGSHSPRMYGNNPNGGGGGHPQQRMMNGHTSRQTTANNNARNASHNRNPNPNPNSNPSHNKGSYNSGNPRPVQQQQQQPNMNNNQSGSGGGGGGNNNNNTSLNKKNIAGVNGKTTKSGSANVGHPHPKSPMKVTIKTYTKQNALPIGATVAYKHGARPYGQPQPNETDPKFTNPIEIASYQRWELLQSAKRWLPGEGTFITWKKHRYLIGPPIHMGMNGHIHYCYKYPIPDPETKRKNYAKKDGSHSSKDGTEEEIEDEGETETSAASSVDANIQPCVETLAAKIVPNTPAFAREIVILRALQKCENVTELYDVLESDRTLISILELAQADVYNFFVGRGSIRHGWNLDKPAIREHFAKMVIKNVVQGLSQMHEKEYLHCDLKSLNILLYIYMTDHSNARGGVYIKAKLTDFGHSSHGKTRISEKLFTNGMARVGTAGHVAPELFVEGSKCDGKIDIWSLGIVMFSMLVPGRLLFGEYTDLGSLKRGYDRLNNMNPWGRDGRDRPSWWTDFERLSPEARDLILWMTRYDPRKRPSANDILSHPWFQFGNSKYRENYRPKLEWVDRLCQSTIAQE